MRKLAVGHPEAVQRFWVSEGESYSLTPEGWLADPSRPAWLAGNTNAVSTTDLPASSCLILLGEPGMGKTRVLADFGPVLPAQFTGRAVTYDLGQFASEARLLARLSNGYETRDWQASDYDLCLTLDGFDEARARIPTLQLILEELLGTWDTRRLLLRVQSRTAEWPRSLQQALVSLYGECEVFELLPLRRQDAATIVDRSGVEPGAFLEAVEASRVVPLAARPLTLKLLSGAFGRSNQPLSSPTHLYDQGIQALLEENNARRRDTTPSDVDLSEQLAIVRRLAVATTLSGKSSLWVGPATSVGPDELKVVDVLAGEGRVWGASAPGAALSSGVFTGQGPHRFGWSHATFADYLAGQWIASSGLSTTQLRALLLWKNGKIHERLRGAAVWAASIAPEQLGWLVDQDAEAFALKPSDLPERLRARLVHLLINAEDEGKVLLPWNWDAATLNYAGMSVDLKAALSSSGDAARKLIITLAVSCRLVDLCPEFVRLARDSTVGTPVRVRAVLAVHNLCGPTDAFASLIGDHSGAEDDPYGDLLGALLLASWPQALPTSEALEVLAAQPDRSHYIGLLHSFIDALASGLEQRDLLSICSWLQNDVDLSGVTHLSPIIAQGLALCIQNLDEPAAQRAVRQIARAKAQDYQPLFGRDGEDKQIPPLSQEQIRRLTTVLLETADENTLLWMLDTWDRGTKLLKGEDLAWLVSEHEFAVQNEVPSLAEKLGRAISMLYDPTDLAQSELILGLPDDHPSAVDMAGWRGWIDLDSPEAQVGRNRSREQASRRAEREGKRIERDRQAAEVTVQLARLAGAAAAGDNDAFWQAVRLVTVPPGTTRYTDEHSPDLTSHPRWEQLPESIRELFVAVTPRYLRERRCNPEVWLGKGVTYYPAAAAYRALLLLLRVAPDELGLLPGSVWREWAPILISWEVATNGASFKDKTILLRLAKEHAEAELHASLLALVDDAIRRREHFLFREELVFLNSPRITLALTKRLDDPMSSRVRSELLEAIPASSMSQIRPILYRWLAADERATDPEKARIGINFLLTKDGRKSWPYIRPLLREAPELMKEALLAVADANHRATPDLPLSAVAELYEWLVEHFPPEEDPQFEEAHFVGPRESVGHWREALMETLVESGHPEALDMVERIVSASQDRRWMRAYVVRAEAAVRRATWEPLDLSALDALVVDRSARIVRTDHELATITMESLSDIQARLQGDTPTAPQIWSTFLGSHPSSEERISDFLHNELKHRLDRQGAIVNREVQVRRVSESGFGERTDLRIESLPPTGSESRHLIIPVEVKGIWNPGLVSSMKDQLIDRYMADCGSTRGIYLVAWFDPDDWTAENDQQRRRRASTWGAAAEVYALLSAEAKRWQTAVCQVDVVVLDASLRRPRRTRP